MCGEAYAGRTLGAAVYSDAGRRAIRRHFYAELSRHAESAAVQSDDIHLQVYPAAEHDRGPGAVVGGGKPSLQRRKIGTVRLF